MKNQKGVNLVSLSVAVIVIITIVGTVLYNVRTNLGVQKLKAMQADIENLRGKVANYYLQYGALPILKQQEIEDSILSENVKTIENGNIETGKYYVIDLSAMENITLTYGEDYEVLKSLSADKVQALNDGDKALTDVYIINSVSHNIFYVHGITYEGKIYYTQYQDDEHNKIGDSNFNINIESKVAKDEKGNVIYTVDKGERAPGNRNAIYKDDDENVAVIPAGYTVSNVDGEYTIENGLVVRDDNQNEWVWIPVSSSDLALMYTQDNTGWTMLGTSVNTLLRTKELIKVSDSEDNRLGTRAVSRTTPGKTAKPYYREPDIVTGDGSDNDAVANNRKAAGFVEADGTTASSLDTMATKLKEDYKDMIESVRKNGGFYVGRYELGKNTSDNNNPQVKAGPVRNHTNWYNLYSACKSFTTGNAESRMIWGCQWDQVCRFIKGNGANSIIDDSRSYGNYNDSSGDAVSNSGPSNFNSTTGQLNSAWKIKNLYDIAGNCWEWTQEAYATNGRVGRGRGLQF